MGFGPRNVLLRYGPADRTSWRVPAQRLTLLGPSETATPLANNWGGLS
jgi:hypothetical protein